MRKISKLLAVCLTGVMLFTACGSSGKIQESSDAKTPDSQLSEINSVNTKEETKIENASGTEMSQNLTEENKTEESKTEENTSMEENTMNNLDPNKPMIALTFDDGPNLVTTPEVLDVLEEYEIVASFFLIGDNINMNNMKVVERAYNMGCEINNHSKTHSDMTKLTAEEIKKEIEYTSNMIENIIGEAPKFFRPPYISVNDTMYDNIDLTFICGHGCNDWENSVTAEQRVEKVLGFADDGVIVLLHDSAYNSQTVEALKTIIPTLLDEGYQFVTVSQLFEAKGIELSADDKNMYTVVE